MKKNHQVLRTSLAAVLLSCLAAATARADYLSTIQSHSPIAYWQFSEAGPSPAPLRLANSGSVGSLGDAYGIPSVTLGVAGIVNNALEFVNPDGTGYCHSRADVIYNPGLNPNVFTVEFWAQPSASFFSGKFDATGACPLSNFNPNNYGGGRVGWLFYVAGGTGKWNLRLGLASGYATGGNVVVNSPVAQAGVWQHIAATYDGTTVNIYINGALAATSTSTAATTGWLPNTGSVLRFGGTPLYGSESYVYWVDTAHTSYYYLPFNESLNTAGNRGWDGLLDEVAIYTNVLSASTIAAHYAAATTPSTYGTTILADNPVGYWNFDEAAVTPPDPSTLPVSANSGTAGSAADGTAQWGAVVGQVGPGYTGFAAGDKAVKFDGRLGSFSANDAPDLHFTGNVTLAAWVKPAARDSIREIISNGLDDNGSETFLRITRGDGVGSGYFYEVGGCDGYTGEYYDSVEVPIPDGDIGNWVFLAGTFDGANWNLYRNGVLMGSTPKYVSTITPGYSDTGALNLTNTWTIGSRAYPSTEDGFNFAGSIAEPAILNSALTAGDILALYQAANVPPVITKALQNPGTVFKGSTVSFSVWAEGNPTLGYQWTSNGVPTGVTTTNYTISNIPVGNFAIGVTVVNAYGTNGSSVNFASVAAPPTIVTPIASTYRFVGYPFTFSVAAGGSAPLTYYWLFGNNVVQAGPSPTYTAVASLANGGPYSVIVSNETGINATSGPVILTVNPVPAGYVSAVVGSGPIAYWRLGETNGTVAHDSIAGNDGTYYLTTLGVPGYSPSDPDTAVSFSGLNSYVGNISGTAINFTGQADFTLEAWVNAPAGQADQATIIAKGIGNSGTTRTEQFGLDVLGGAYHFFTSLANNTIVGPTAVSGPNGTWQHVVGVYDALNTTGGGANMYIYVNGVQENQVPTPAALNNATSPVSIGSKRTGNDPNYDGTFNGTVDEVAVYAKALDAATVAAHYSAIYGSTTPPFIITQPLPITNYVTLPVQFSVVAGGSVPLSYQWKRNGVDLLDGPTASGSVIAGSATPSLTISGLAPDLSDAGTYSVGVSNVIGGVNKGLVSVGPKLTVLAAPTAPVSIPGLVVHLPFDGNLTDATSRGNNGVSIHTTTNIAGGGYSSNVVAATFASDGKVGKAFSYATTAAVLGGSSIATDATYATLGVRPDLQFSSNVNFTVALWTRLPLNYQAGDLPFFGNAKGSETNPGFDFAPTYAYGTAGTATDAATVAGGWAANIYDTNSTAGLLLYSDTLGSINDGSWHHLVYVCDRSKGLKVYLDGVLAGSKTEAGTTIVGIGSIDTGYPATIGQDPSGFYGETGSGDIDDLGVWRVALAPLDVASIYMAAQGGFSFTGPPPQSSLPPLTIKNTAGNIQITWTQGSLYAAGTVTGPYTNVPNAVSPYPVPKPGPATLFYRAQQ